MAGRSDTDTEDLVADLIADLPPILTAAEAGEFLQLHEKTVRNYVAVGRIRGFRTNPGKTGRIRIPRAAIADYLRSRV